MARDELRRLRRKLGVVVGDDDDEDGFALEVDDDDDGLNGSRSPNVPDAKSLSATVTVERSVQPAPYESAKVFLAISGIRPETTPDEMDEILDQTKIAYIKIVERIRLKTEKLRQEWAK